MQFYEVQLDIAIPDRKGAVIKHKAGDVVPETDIQAGSLESCLRLRQLVPCQAPASVEPEPAPVEPDKPKHKK